MKNIERSNDKMLGGVCAGLAKSVNINPILLRLLTVIAVLFTGGTVILVYLLCWIIIPKEEIEENHSTSLKIITSPGIKLLIIGTCGLIGLVAGAAVGFFMVGSSAGNVLIPLLGIIGLIIGGMLGISVVAIKKSTNNR